MAGGESTLEAPATGCYVGCMYTEYLDAVLGPSVRSMPPCLLEWSPRKYLTRSYRHSCVFKLIRTEVDNVGCAPWMVAETLVGLRC